MSIPNGKNVYGYADAYAKLANFGQQHLLKYYDELDEAQRAALLNQIEQIDFSVVSTNKQPEKRGRITPIGVTELAEIRRGAACGRHGHTARFGCSEGCVQYRNQA